MFSLMSIIIIDSTTDTACTNMFFK